MERKEAKIQIRCARVGLEVYLDSTEQYLTGYEAFSDMSGQNDHRDYYVCWRMQEKHLGHRLLLIGRGFQREILLNEDLLAQGEPDICIDLLEGRLVKALSRREWLMSCDAAEAWEFLYQEIGNLKENSPAYRNAWEQLLLAGNRELSEDVRKIRGLITDSRMAESFDRYSREFFQRYGYPEGVKAEPEYQKAPAEEPKPRKLAMEEPAKKSVNRPAALPMPVFLAEDEEEDEDLDARIEAINDHIREAAEASPFRIKEIFHEFGSGPQSYEETDKIIKRTEAYLNGRRD